MIEGNYYRILLWNWWVKQKDMWKPFIVPGNVFLKRKPLTMRLWWSMAETDGYWPHNRMNSRVGPLPFHKCCSVLRCALKVFVLFCMVLLYLYLRIFFFADFSANKLQQHQDSNAMSPTDTSQEIWDTCSGLGPQLFRWMQPESDSRYNVFSSCPCFPGLFLSYHSCIWPCSRTDSPLASEKSCFWNLVLSIQAD